MANFSPDFPRHSFSRVDMALSPPFLSGWYFTARMGPRPHVIEIDRRSAKVHGTCFDHAGVCVHIGGLLSEVCLS